MHLRTLILALAVTAAPLAAQSASLDQSSPYDNASFNGALPGWVWEQQVRTGISGQLAGFELQVNSYLPNDAMTVEIVDGALGAGGAVLWHGQIRTTAINVWQDIKVNVLPANIIRTANDLFIIRIIADSNGMGFNGNAYAPNPPGYPEDFWENGASLGGGLRLGFKTFVSDGPVLSKTGSCPGPIALTLTGATPGGGVAMLHGVPGTFTKPGGQCAGLRLNIAQPSFVGILSANALGQASINFTAPPGLCGRTVLGVDLASCTSSNGVTL